jgi:hypothetical protein
MTPLKDGGQAFPISVLDKKTVELGMSLRDYLAAKALPAIIISCSHHDAGASILYWDDGSSVDRSTYTDTAYKFADAMMLSREKE